MGSFEKLTAWPGSGREQLGPKWELVFVPADHRWPDRLRYTFLASVKANNRIQRFSIQPSEHNQVFAPIKSKTPLGLTNGVLVESSLSLDRLDFYETPAENSRHGEQSRP
jgi:hypothetical protein